MVSLRSLFVPLALAASLASSHAQTVTVDVSDGAVQRFEIAGPARISYTGTTVTISFGPPSPTPSPPTPNPTPAPVPIPAGKLHVTLVWDPSAETLQAARTRADLATATEWDAMGVTFRALADTDPAIDARNLRAKLGKLPCVLVQRQDPADPKGRSPVVATLPAVDKAATVAAVRELQGAGR